MRLYNTKVKILDIKTTPESEIIRQSCAVLSSGGLLVYPTETTYGIGANAEDESAIKKLLAYKEQRNGKPLSVAVFDQKMAQRYVSLNETAKRVYTTFLPGPVTVVSKSLENVQPLLKGQTNTLGIRIPNYDLIRHLLQKFGKGMTATGANASYKKRPYTIQDILDSTSKKQQLLIDLILDAGELPHNPPSTVIDTTLDDVKVLRAGSIQFGNKEVFLSTSPLQTQEIAVDTLRRFRSYLTYVPIIIALQGEMGAGKTEFTKGLARALDIPDLIHSPTYTLSHEYPFVHEERKSNFVHIDTWRLLNDSELKQLGTEKLISQKSVLAIEWADKVREHLLSLTHEAILLSVLLESKDEQSRKITITASIPPSI